MLPATSMYIITRWYNVNDKQEYKLTERLKESQTLVHSP